MEKRWASLGALALMLLIGCYLTSATEVQVINAQIAPKLTITAPNSIDEWVLSPSLSQPQSCQGGTVSIESNYQTKLAVMKYGGPGYFWSPTTGSLGNPLSLRSSLSGVEVSLGEIPAILESNFYRGSRAHPVTYIQSVTWFDRPAIDYSITVTYYAVPN